MSKAKSDETNAGARSARAPGSSPENRAKGDRDDGSQLASVLRPIVCIEKPGGAKACGYTDCNGCLGYLDCNEEENGWTPPYCYVLMMCDTCKKRSDCYF